jgi:hypothetical protein
VITLQRGNELVTAASTTLLNTLGAQATSSSTIAIDLAIPANATPGTYSVSLSAPDTFTTTATDARFSIRFANADSGAQQWNATAARFATGTSVIVE